ncbi:MAG: SDR family oxidoreductase [Vicinamibacterales bacterium]|nr:SDR family oxidoreductase [Vicinamibacterales bacterium]
MTDIKRTSLITGASAGIGAAFAEVFAANGFDLILTARRAERLEAMAADLRTRYGRVVHVVPADLAEPGAVERLCSTLAGQGLTADALVNNAGYGVPGLLTTPAWERQRDLLQVLVGAVVELTHRLLPGMLARGYGRIINVSSLAGLIPAPAGHTLYPAAKSFVMRFSEALAEETRGKGVHVTALCPGFTLSEFHDVTGTRPSVSKLPSLMWMDAPSVARSGFDAVMAGIPVHVPGRANRVIAFVARHAPWVLVQVQRRFSWAYRKTT